MYKLIALALLAAVRANDDPFEAAFDDTVPVTDDTPDIPIIDNSTQPIVMPTTDDGNSTLNITPSTN